MFQIILGLLLLYVLIRLVNGVTQAPPERRNKVLGYSALGLFCLLLLLLVLSGRVHILVALGAALIPLIKQLPRFLPFWHAYRNARVSEGQRGKTGSGTSGGWGNKMSYEEACSILGLSGKPTRAEIIEAHRRLIQKFHPDRGGSEYLAARINQARDLLLQ